MNWVVWLPVALAVLAGEAVLWLFVRQARKTGSVAFFSLARTNEADDLVKFARIVGWYRLQLVLFPLLVIAIFVTRPV